MARGDLTDREWAMIGPLLPPERGRWARPAGDYRRFLNGMLHVLRVGCPWRDMHERYGKWNSVYVRFRRWAEQGVWDALLQTLVDLGLSDDWQHVPWSVPTHRQRAQKGGSFGGFWSITRRLYEQNPCLMRQSGTPSQLSPHRRTGLGL
ncbi:transposase [Asaia sp. BMEF1]|uniref:transposase n=1 Tax=Asaia sp. BMEF1 TaxID=3155932 RepID=UPI003F6717D2